MRAWVVALMAVLTVAAVIVVRALVRDDGVVVDGSTLSASLARELGADEASCIRGRRFQYRCDVSGDAYRVRFTSGKCWRAAPFVGIGNGVTGCVTADDQPD